MMRVRFGTKLLTAGLSAALLLSSVQVIQPQSSTTAYAASASIADSIISTGERYMGRTYKFGAKTGNTSSFDCSSFTQYIYRVNGVTIPRSSKQQAKAGTYVSKKNLKPGDLVFFYSPISHVAVYIGNGKILHTYGNPGVTISNINSGWWSKNYNTARRVISQSGQAVTSSSASQQAAKIVRSVNFRTGPSLSNSRIRTLRSGEVVQVISKVNKYWYKIKDKNGKKGYVSTSLKYIRV
jgi:lipoprotein Spr